MPEKKGFIISCFQKLTNVWTHPFFQAFRLLNFQINFSCESILNQCSDIFPRFLHKVKCFPKQVNLSPWSPKCNNSAGVNVLVSVHLIFAIVCFHLIFAIVCFRSIIFAEYFDIIWKKFCCWGIVYFWKKTDLLFELFGNLRKIDWSFRNLMLRC